MFTTTIPEWPLPCDWKWAGGETVPPPVPSSPNPTVRCPHCTQWLSLPPNDQEYGVRRHKKGSKCKKGREVVAMNREGFHVMSMSGGGFWAEVLRPFMRQGKFYKFFPAPIVSFCRWQLHGATSSGKADKEFHKELEKFLAMTEEQQCALLQGAILEHEYKQEDGIGRHQARIGRR